MNNDQGTKMAAELKKNKGNRFFKDGEYQQAVECYSAAINLDSTNHLIYGNRSQAYLNLNMPVEAEIDCNKALLLDTSYIKGYHRRGLARKLRCQYKLALQDFQRVLFLDEKNQQALNEIEEINRLLNIHEPIRIKAIYKSELTKCQDRPLDIKIEQTQNEEMMDIISKECPEVIPINSFQFYQRWRELNDQSKIEYLTMIGPQQLSKIFKKSIEPLIFCEILRLLQYFHDVLFKYQFLFHLTSIDRFKTLVLFLEEEEKNILTNLFKEMQSDNSLNQSNLDKLRTNYCFT